jgi:hypothetical protein
MDEVLLIRASKANKHETSIVPRSGLNPNCASVRTSLPVPNIRSPLFSMVVNNLI